MLHSGAPSASGRCLPPLLAVAVLAMLLAGGCMGRSESPSDGVHRVGVYNEEENVTQYTFKDKDDAKKLRDKLRERGHDAHIRRDKSADPPVYEVYVREGKLSAEDLRWPAAPAQTRIAYLGELKDRESLKALGEGRIDSEEERITLQEVAYGLDYTTDRVLVRPYAVAVDDSGKVFVSDMKGILLFDVEGNRVRRYMQTSQMAPGKDAGGTTKILYAYPTPLLHPLGIAFGPENVLYVAENGFGKVLAFRDKKAVLEIGEEKGMEAPYGIAVDKARGHILVTEPRRNLLSSFDLAGNWLFSVGADGESEGGGEGQQPGAPVGVAVNSKGEIHVIDQGRARVNVYSPEGQFLRTIGSYGNYPGQFARPKGVGIDSDDNVYVSDVAFNNLQIFDSQGALLLVIGTGGSDPGKFFLPVSVYVDSRDRVYVAETGNDRVQVFQYFGSKHLSMSPVDEDEL